MLILLKFFYFNNTDKVTQGFLISLNTPANGLNFFSFTIVKAIENFVKEKMLSSDDCRNIDNI